MTTDEKRKPAINSTYKKLAVQWLNDAFCPPEADFVVADHARGGGFVIANFLQPQPLSL